MTTLGRVALAARVFALAAVLSVSIVLGASVIRGAVTVVIVGVCAQILSATGRIPERWLSIVEGGVTGVLAAALWPSNDAIIPYLLVPALVAGLAAGLRGVAGVLCTEGIVTTASWLALMDSFDRGTLASAFLWFLTSLGLGALGVAFRRAIISGADDPSYREALHLIKQLHALSGKLTAGLDAVGLAEKVLERASQSLPITQAVVLVRTPTGLLAPLRFSPGANTDALVAGLDWVERAWRAHQPAVRGHRAAIALRAVEEPVAILLVECLTPPSVAVLRDLDEALAADAVQLHAALLFSDVRDAATSEERQRLAREVHDGIAQDVASLGYLVDHLAHTATTKQQEELVAQLRQEVTRLVRELRHSVFELRHEVGAGHGLGESIATFARHVGSHSDLTVHVVLDEGPTRLRPDVEAELLRIAQEAINNARKHSEGSNLWVHCAVHPPLASLEIRDDGKGLGPSRDDSHGLHIMRERAERIGAVLEVAGMSGEDPGTRVSVRLGVETTSLPMHERVVTA